jgi:hypothetical protein
MFSYWQQVRSSCLGSLHAQSWHTCSSSVMCHTPALGCSQAKAHEREQRLQEQVEARDSQIQAQDEQISVARQAASKLEVGRERACTVAF